MKFFIILPCFSFNLSSICNEVSSLFLMLVTCVFSPIFLICLARILLILLYFVKNSHQFWFLFFFYCLFISMLISTLYFLPYIYFSFNILFFLLFLIVEIWIINFRPSFLIEAFKFTSRQF